MQGCKNHQGPDPYCTGSSLKSGRLAPAMTNNAIFFVYSGWGWSALLSDVHFVFVLKISSNKKNTILLHLYYPCAKRNVEPKDPEQAPVLLSPCAIALALGYCNHLHNFPQDPVVAQAVVQPLQLPWVGATGCWHVDATIAVCCVLIGRWGYSVCAICRCWDAFQKGSEKMLPAEWPKWPGLGSPWLLELTRAEARTSWSIVIYHTLQNVCRYLHYIIAPQSVTVYQNYQSWIWSSLHDIGCLSRWWTRASSKSGCLLPISQNSDQDRDLSRQEDAKSVLDNSLGQTCWKYPSNSIAIIFGMDGGKKMRYVWTRMSLGGTWSHFRKTSLQYWLDGGRHSFPYSVASHVVERKEFVSCSFVINDWMLTWIQNSFDCHRCHGGVGVGPAQPKSWWVAWADDDQQRRHSNSEACRWSRQAGRRLKRPCQPGNRLEVINNKQWLWAVVNSIQ